MMCEIATEQIPRLSPPNLPLLIAEPMAWYFGPWGEFGHFLHDTTGRHVWSTDVCPFAESAELDGFLAPIKSPKSADPCYRMLLGKDDLSYEEYPEGQFLVHHRRVTRKDYTIAAWWDRTQGDPRPNSNACLIVEGRHLTNLIPNILRHYFPIQFRNLETAGRDLRPVPTIRSYDLKDVRITFQGIELKGFINNPFIEVWCSEEPQELQFGSLLKGSVEIDHSDGPEFS